MIDDERLKELFSKEEINNKIEKLANEINRTYQGKEVLIIGILKGAFIFMADLVRKLDLKTEIDFVELSSYGPKKESSGEVKMVKGLNTEIRNKDLLIVEDIIDTGTTMAYFLDYLKEKDPKSIKLCALTDKPARRKVEISIDFLGFTVPNKFIVGYGIDYHQNYRNLSEIYYVEE